MTTLKRILCIQPLRPEAIALLDARSADVAYTVVTDFTEANLLAHVAEVDAITIRDAPPDRRRPRPSRPAPALPLRPSPPDPR